MRILFSIIATGALGFLGYVTYSELQPRGQMAAGVAPVPPVAVAAEAILEAMPEAPVVEEESVINDTARPSAEAIIASEPPPAPRIRTAPPGTYFLTTRVSITTDAGVIALLPGEAVKIVYRDKNGSVRVNWGDHELIVPEAQLTKEIDLATNQPIPAAPVSRLLGQRSR